MASLLDSLVGGVKRTIDTILGNDSDTQVG
jgi:hypothetical protein